MNASDVTLTANNKHFQECLISHIKADLAEREREGERE